MKPELEQTTNELPPGLPREVRRHVLLSWVSLAAERLYPIVWPAGGFAGFFVVLALANVFVYVPEWLHLVVLTGFFGVMVWSVAWSLRQSSIPSHAQAIRHLEQSSGFQHRPLSALEDKPAIIADNDTKQLWRAHQRWVFTHIHRLKVAWPSLSLTAKDPHAIRILLGLAIVALAVANWDEVPSRLASALSPGIAQGHTPASFEAWVTPPAYTGEASKHLTALTRVGDGGDLRVPKGSVLIVRTHGAASAVMRASTFGGEVPRQSRPEFLSAGGDARDAKLVIDSNVAVKLSLNATLVGNWRFQTTPDMPPKITFKTPLAVTQAQSLRFNYAMQDDFGVATAQAHIALSEQSYVGTSKAALTFDLPLPPSPARNGEAMIFKDLTSHVWAGLSVTVHLIAKDELGQTATSKAVRIRLPERRFTDPLARALVEQRRNLARDPRSSGTVAKALDALTLSPERFMPDKRVYLTLRTAAYEVLRARLDATRIDHARIASAQQLLWDLALRVEDGDAPQAQAELREIQRRLMEALSSGASKQEIERLMAQMRAALERSLRALAQKSPGQSAFMQSQNGQVIRSQDLQAMMDQIQNLVRQGASAAAQQKLSELLNLLENVQTAGNGKMSPEQQAAAKSLENLGSILSRQRELMDQTFREQQAVSGSDGKKSPALQSSQDKLSNELTPIIKQLSKNPEGAAALKRAQDAMDNASDSLGSGELSSAGKSQQKAIDEMRKGGQALAQQMLQQMAGPGAMVPGSTGAGAGENEDPFGRPQSSSGPTHGNSVKVPDKLDIQKAREILEELQRRAAERGRPDTELEYLERLLRRF